MVFTDIRDDRRIDCFNTFGAGYVAETGNETEKIAEQHEEEDGPQVRQVLVRLVVQVRDRDLVAEIDEDRLDEVAKSARHQAALTGRHVHDDDQRRGGEPHEDDVLRDAETREIDPEDLLTVDEVVNDVDAAGITPGEDHRVVSPFVVETFSRARIQASAITSRK